MDKTITIADPGTADQIRKLYGDMVAFNENRKESEVQIKALHSANKQTQTLALKMIKKIDSDTISRLDSDVKQANDHYKPMFSTYTALNKQIGAARLVKDKNLAASLNLQANMLKPVAQAAHQDIRLRKARLADAKKQASQTMRTIRGTFDDITLEQKIRDILEQAKNQIPEEASQQS